MKPMRRKDRQMPEEEARALLAKGEYGVLATVEEGDQPYGVPLSYVVVENSIYFHCAYQGHKVENLRHQPKVCFTVVGGTKPVFSGGDFSTLYQSVVVFGTAAEVTEDAKKAEVLTALCQKYMPEYSHEIPASLAKDGKHTAVWAVAIQQISGKSKKEE
ncbi:pyridoxamine 5'-phosphate oxidase family protein [Ruminococcaceae bacterium OttesenSCG-928-A16]|nr:pyridoxamine 5'-phosphate oxidase family protein [Ruminococcaceae bacterium OttesenSCG-928-A16]